MNIEYKVIFFILSFGRFVVLWLERNDSCKIKSLVNYRGVGIIVIICGVI